MKRALTLISIGVLLFGAGVASSQFFTKLGNRATDSYIVKYRCPTIDELITLQHKEIVIAVASDEEFYLGRNRMSLDEIPEKIESLVKNIALDERLVFLRATDSVKYATIAAIVEKLRGANVTRIELIPNKKRGTTQ